MLIVAAAVSFLSLCSYKGWSRPLFRCKTKPMESLVLFFFLNCYHPYSIVRNPFLNNRAIYIKCMHVCSLPKKKTTDYVFKWHMTTLLPTAVHVLDKWPSLALWIIFGLRNYKVVHNIDYLCLILPIVRAQDVISKDNFQPSAVE